MNKKMLKRKNTVFDKSHSRMIHSFKRDSFENWLLNKSKNSEKP